VEVARPYDATVGNFILLPFSQQIANMDSRGKEKASLIDESTPPGLSLRHESSAEHVQ
jgi:hypothetical protein